MDFTKYENYNNPTTLTFQDKKCIADIKMKLEKKEELPESVVEVLEAFISDKEKHEQQLSEDEEQSDMQNQFRLDLFEELKVSDNHKRDTLYQLAVHYSNGSLESIYNYAEELSELIK